MMWQSSLPVVAAIAERPPLVTAMKWCGCEADFTASAAMRTLPAVPFWKPPGEERRAAGPGGLGLGVVRAPIAAHPIGSALFGGVVIAGIWVPAGRPRLFTAESTLRASL